MSEVRNDGMSTSETRRPSHHPAGMAIGLAVGLVLGLLVNLLSKNRDTFWLAPFLGWLTPGRIEWVTGHVVEPIGKVFLRLILCVVLPLVFSALVLAVVELKDIRKLGALGLRAIGFTLLFSACSVMIGLGLVHVFGPGYAISEQTRAEIQSHYRISERDGRPSSKSLSQVLLDLIPENPLQEAVGALDGSAKGNGMLALMVFALLVGCATVNVGSRTDGFVGVLEGLFAISMKIVDWAMRIAPLGVGCLMFAAMARLGMDLVVPLFGFLAVALAGLAVQTLGVYPAALRLCGIRPGRFFGAIRHVMLTAFGTSSSNATLPTALRAAEDDLGLSPQIARFVLTVGATGNQNGTALYEGVVILFLCQVFGVHLTLLQQASVMVFAILAGVGTAGVPAGSIPMIMAILAGIGVPPDGIGLILGFDRFLDMCRTVVNVTGDLTIAQCLDAWHKKQQTR